MSELEAPYILFRWPDRLLISSLYQFPVVFPGLQLLPVVAPTASAAIYLSATKRDRAMKLLKLAESLARERGKETLPLGERLADIAAGYRHHGADADAWRVLKEAAIEATKYPDSDRYAFGQRLVAKQAAAYNLAVALTLIGFDLDNPPKANFDRATLTES